VGLVGIVAAVMLVVGSAWAIITSIIGSIGQALTCGIAQSGVVQFGIEQMQGKGDLATGSSSVVGTAAMIGPGSLTLTMFDKVLPVAFLLAGACAAARLVYDLALHRGQNSPLVPIMTNMLPKLGIVALLIAPNPTGTPLAYATMAFLVTGFDHLAQALFAAFGQATQNPTQCGVAGNLTQYLIATGSTPLANLIGIIAAALFFFYDIFLMLLRLIFLVFCFALAPLMIALVMWSPKNRFIQTWTELFFGALIIPSIMASIFSITLAVAIGVLNVPAGVSSAAWVVQNPINMLLSELVFIAGLWFAGKMVAKLVWHGVGSAHHSATGALMATYAGVRGGEIGARAWSSMQSRSRHQQVLASQKQAVPSGSGASSSGSKQTEPAAAGGLNRGAEAGMTVDATEDPGVPPAMGAGEAAAFDVWMTKSEQGRAVLGASGQPPTAETLAQFSQDKDAGAIINHLKHDFVNSPAVTAGWVTTPEKAAQMQLPGGVNRYVEALSKAAPGGGGTVSPHGWPTGTPGAGPAPTPAATPVPAAGYGPSEEM
jgi:hypothetical protein